jgi:5-methyltetrahydrofolate--homocysteine methyltransferase
MPRGRTVIVAGSVGPTGEIMAPMGSADPRACGGDVPRTGRGAEGGGADVLWVETISAPEEYRAAAEAAKLADMPWCGTMSFDTAGRTMMGFTSADLAAMVETLDIPPSPMARIAGSARRTFCAPCWASARPGPSGP